eukprot:NODE_34_length_31639_cov_0.254375.p19 type:complete len:148 gc:universal NODE_34_length_31639_cov_0.254375:26400-26843(+)
MQNHKIAKQIIDIKRLISSTYDLFESKYIECIPIADSTTHNISAVTTNANILLYFLLKVITACRRYCKNKLKVPPQIIKDMVCESIEYVSAAATLIISSQTDGISNIEEDLRYDLTPEVKNRNKTNCCFGNSPILGSQYLALGAPKN